MFQLFQTYVPRVFIWVLHIFHTLCCKCFIRMLYMFHTYVASVSFKCYICFAIATHMFSLCFRRMLQVFQLFRTYVANVSSRCCKSRFGVAHVAVGLIYSNRLLQLLNLATCAWFGGGAIGRRGKQCGRRSRQSGTRHGATQDTDRAVAEFAQNFRWGKNIPA
jgi:hypothetical protein